MTWTLCIQYLEVATDSLRLQCWPYRSLIVALRELEEHLRTDGGHMQRLWIATSPLPAPRYYGESDFGSAYDGNDYLPHGIPF